ncbi:MAG: DUF3179 domain-containing protein [Nitrospirae bacterium]|nr:MAG: DUF3179 domain-containing protein [Nitrospirota bacterium]
MKSAVQIISGFVIWGIFLGASWDDYNGFDLTQHSIPVKDILRGGPPRDGIPAILHPKFVSAQEASFLQETDRVLGVTRGREAKAYPIKILNWHEIVNDTIGGQPVLITYCPLCGTGIGFDRVIAERKLTFGVSGLLYQSDLLMYDHQTESLWSQIAMEAVTGPMTGQKLQPLFLEHTTWSDWRRRYPHTLVLSTETGYHRRYDRDPYADYALGPGVMFPVKPLDGRLALKEWVIGIEVNGQAKAYPFSVLKWLTAPLKDRVNGQGIIVHFDPKHARAVITDEAGTPIPAVTAYWFAWAAFHPDTLIFRARGEQSP